MKTFLASMIFVVGVLFISCSGTKEETPPPKVEIKTPLPPVEKPKRNFAINDRYYVKNAVLASPTKIDDPLQAIRVIQLQEGAGETLVLFTMQEMIVNEELARYETWMGIELPSFAPGVYDIAEARVQYYRFFLVKKGVRYDGNTYSGTIKIESVEDGYLIGSIDIKIVGESKSFDKPSEIFETTWKGDFRVQEVPIEATMMKMK